jgi:hypothetical protein
VHRRRGTTDSIASTTNRAAVRLVSREAHVAIPVGGGAGPVVVGSEASDQPGLEDCRRERIGSGDVMDRVRLAQHRSDLSAGLSGGEVTANPLPEVGGLSHVQHAVVDIAEHVHARCARKIFGEPEFGGERMGVESGQADEIVEAQHSESSGPFDQEVQQVGGGKCIVECAVARLMGEPQPRGEGAEFAVGNLVADESTSQRHGVDHDVGERIPIGANEGGVHEPHVESCVVGNQNRIADEVEK